MSVKIKSILLGERRTIRATDIATDRGIGHELLLPRHALRFNALDELLLLTVS